MFGRHNNHSLARLILSIALCAAIVTGMAPLGSVMAGDISIDDSGPSTSADADSQNSSSIKQESQAASASKDQSSESGTGSSLQIQRSKENNANESENSESREAGNKTADGSAIESTTADGKTMLKYSGGDYEVTVTCGNDSGISDACTLSASEIDKDSDEYKKMSDRYQAADDRYEKDGTTEIPRDEIDSAAKKIQKQSDASAEESEESGKVTVTTGGQVLRFFDVRILNEEGKEIEPAAPVQVEITFDSLEGLSDKDDLKVVHDGSEKTDVITGDDLKTEIKKDPAEGGKLTFELDSFSTVGVYYGDWNAYNVMIDPTNGGMPVTHSNGTTSPEGVYYYNGTALSKDYSLSVSNNSWFDLPRADQVTPPTAGYSVGYKLNGWYNVDKKTWFKPGDEIDASVYNGTTFYADWVPANYNIGTADHSVSTTNYPFIKTRVFDYNDLYNARSCMLTTNGVVGDGRTLKWSQGREPVFFDSKGRPGTLMQVLNRGADSSSQNWATQGLADRMIPNLFKPDKAWNTVNRDSTITPNNNGIPGVTYVGDGNNLFQYGQDKEGHDGYYYYASTRNATSYNRSQDRFYVYDYTEETRASVGGDNSDFLPFNSGNWNRIYENGPYRANGTKISAPYEVNYWFGMSTEVNFFLPNNVGEQDSSGAYGNKSKNGDDMVYKFSGDDDVWVYIDDQLVLDMGGVHGVVSGEINFSTGKVTITPTNGSTPYTIPVITGDNGIKAGDHTLKMYYMERGGSESNCSLYFNLAPRYSLTLTKQNKDTNENLAGAVFGVYLDEACSVPASLWATNGDENKKTYTFTTDQNGQINCSGLCAGNTYYLKELKPPSGYPDVSDAVIKLTIDNTGHAEVLTLSGEYSWMLAGNTDTKKISSEESDSNTKGTFKIAFNIRNKKTTSVHLKKIWKDSNGRIITNTSGKSAKFELWRKTTPSSGNSGGTHTVTFKTQYFDSLILGNGVNHDVLSVIRQGPEQSVTVSDGSSLPFDVKALGQNGNMGIYSVAANSQLLNGNTSDSTGDYKFLVSGQWISLDRNGSYKLENIKKDTVVTVTFIGYLNWVDGKPSPDASFSVTPGEEIKSTTSDSSSGTTTGGTDEKVTDISDADITLPYNNNWSYLWSGLPAQDQNGNTYYYYVKEETPAGYAVSIDNNDGISGGTITATNTA